MFAKLTANLVSSPGIGKSAILHQIAEKFNLKVIDIRLTEYDPTELNGYPFILNPNDPPELVKAGHVPMNTFPIVGDEIPDGYAGWMIILDEFPSAALAVQAAAYKITLDHMVGSHKLHEKVVVCTAGNKIGDKALVNRMSTAQQSRVQTLVIRCDTPTWLVWADEAMLDHRVRSFIRFMPEELYKFNPNHADLTFACPRTWDFTSKLAKRWESIFRVKLPLLAGTVGHGAAQLFFSYCEIFDELPTIKQIIADPLGCHMGDEPSVHFAVAGLVSHHVNAKNAKALLTFVERIPADLQVVALRNAIKRDDAIRCIPELKTWNAKHTKELIA
jgi:hypothetical protein